MAVTLDRARPCGVSREETPKEAEHNGNGVQTDSALVARSRDGDFQAFEELVRRYRNDVYGVAYHFMRNREEAWDVSQEVFIKAHRGLKRFRGDASFKTWLLRITSNQCKDHLKKRRLDTVPFDEAIETHDSMSAHTDPAHDAEVHEMGDAIMQALDTLSHKHKTAIVLRELEGLSYEEMASAMECSIGTVMSRLHHARRKLRDALVRTGIVGDDGHER